MRLAACLSVILFTAGCGYVGPVLPPSPQIPATITDLSAIERGDKIMITFSTPPRTTDNVGIARFSEIDLRIGPEQQPPESAKAYSVPLPPPSDRDDPQPKGIAYSIDTSDWIGQHVAISVRTSVKKSDHFSSWSRKAVLDVISPLQRPAVHAESSANGIVLTWPSTAGMQYQIQRQSPTDKQPMDLAIVNDGRYVDVSAQYDTEYRYTVTARKTSAESLPSEPLVFSAIDKFAPAVPTGLTALVGPDAIDLAWQRNTEPDLHGYYVFRSTNNGPFERQGDLVALPSYVDHNVEHSKTYSYKVSAIDKKANESAPSSPAEVQY